MAIDHEQLAGDIWVGAPVYCCDGEELGHVKAIRAAHFKVDAPLQPDYWLRRDIVARVTADGVTITVEKDHLSVAQVGDPELDPGPPTATATVAPPDHVPATVPNDHVPAALPGISVLGRSAD